VTSALQATEDDPRVARIEQRRRKALQPGRPRFLQDRVRISMRVRLLLSILAALLVGQLVSVTGAQVASTGNNHDFPALVYSGKVYIGTPTGLLAYDAQTDIWTVTYTGKTPAANRINALGVDENILWIATDGGVVTTDLRLGDLIGYSREDGLPSDTALSLVFEEDYAWAGTAGGAGRFDKLSETWESFGVEDGLAGSRVDDIVFASEKLWFATEGGASEYDSEQEIWRSYGKTGVGFQRICLSGKFIWFLGKGGAARYDPRTRSWTSYGLEETGAGKDGESCSAVVSEGDSLWVVRGGEILLYDPDIDAFKEFEYSSDLEEREVRYVDLSGTEMWVATDSDVGRFDRKSKAWRFYGRAQGLVSHDFVTIFVSGSTVFACAADGSVSYLKLAEEKWYRRDPIPPVEERRGVGVRPVSDENGTGVMLGPLNKFLLKGSTTWTGEMGKDGRWGDPDGRSDLALHGTVFGGRSLAGRYDDTDLEKTIYGLTFRGGDRDVLEEASLGQSRCEFGRDRLVRSLEMEGAAVRTGYGGVGRGERLVGLSARSGERRSGFDSDFYIGTRRDARVELKDVDYVRGTFFVLDTTSLLEGPVVMAGSEKLYFDDGSVETNTPNTIVDTIIAGVTGDFDLLLPLADYVIDNSSGVIRLQAPVTDQGVLAVAYVSPAGRRELILWSVSATDHELSNRYSFGMSIIPRSFAMAIVDTEDQIVGLSLFNLDRNMDGKVDPDFMDYGSGILSFPDRRPFPGEVYDFGTHIYTMRVTYATTSPTYTLSHRRIVRLSETVRLDGAVLTRGDDYIVDYTSGTVVMLREEMIGDRSQIDVIYEYERDSDEELQMVDLGLDPGDNLRVNIRGIRFDDDDSGLERSDIVHGSIELKTRILGHDVRAPVELARGVSDTTNDGTAQRYSLYAKSSGRSFFLGYRSYEKNFHSLSPERGRFGALNKAYGFDAESHILDWLVVETEFERQEFFPDTSEPGPVSEDGRSELTFTKRRLPAFSVWFSGQKSKTSLAREWLEKLGSDVSYALTKEEFKRLPVRSLKFESSIARTWWSEDRGDSAGRYDGGSVGVTSTVVRGVSLGWEYLLRQSSQDSVGQTSRGGEVRLSSSIERIPGFSFYAKTEREADEAPYGLMSGQRDGELRWRDYGRAGIYPGIFFTPLSSVNFEYEISENLVSSLRALPGELSLGQRYLNRPRTFAFEETDSRVQNFKGRYRPAAVIILDLGYERTREREEVVDSQNGTARDRYTGKVEYRPRFRSVVTLYYDMAREEESPVASSRTLSPSAWWEERWAPWMLSKATLSYATRQDSLGVIETKSSSLIPQISATMRAREVPLVGDLELTTDASIRRTYSFSGATSESTIYGSSFAIDVKPRRLVRLKVELDLSYEFELTKTAMISLSGTF
jgi:hypothetical protein